MTLEEIQEKLDSIFGELMEISQESNLHQKNPISEKILDLIGEVEDLINLIGEEL
ncbi:hypothetical protein NDI37_21810 [Funiculus sociatus GB2-A5]|uniref:Uncharacterized protein n=1 Tax=Funiculus sociatus GB2-A5 TaxID=2933946 RepID=A0ABV0JUK9_9CYAN|nr:hypothetical protein [Trichocoleus sp. FACHB-6]MBD2060732.1 hypothetical protein [Trichocoleus sp. FACHB-6]